MPTATIVAKFVNPPQQGKKSGSIKTPENEYYGVPAAMLGQFTQGGTYTVEYKTREWNGKTYKDILSISQAQAPSQNQGSGGGSKYGSYDAETSERVFVCGALNAFIKAGKIETNANAVVGAVNALRSAWAQTFGKQQSSQAPAKNSNDMNDEIPW